MTDAQAPRAAGPGLGPNALPSVSWFEFVLQETLLEEHLAKENPEPSAVQLIVQFMQQAETEMTYLIQNTREQNAASVSQPQAMQTVPDIRMENANGIEHAAVSPQMNFARNTCNKCMQPKSTGDDHPACFRCSQCSPENTCQHCAYWRIEKWYDLRNRYKQGLQNVDFNIDPSSGVGLYTKEASSLHSVKEEASSKLLSSANFSNKCFCCKLPKSSSDNHLACFQCSECYPQVTCLHCVNWPRKKWADLMNRYMPEDAGFEGKAEFCSVTEMKLELKLKEEMKVEEASDCLLKAGGDDLAIEETGKVKALRVLAIQVAAHLHWDLAVLENGVPTPIVQALLIQLLKMAAPEVIDCIHSPDLEDTAMSDQAFFAVQLFHRWCVRSVVRDSFPTKPRKPIFFPQPGQVDPNALMTAATDTIIRKFKEQLPSSISFLEKCCQDQPSVKMPTASCFILPKERSDASADWEQIVVVPAEKIVCQIAFDLGSLYFFEREYRKAFEKFRTCKQILNELTDETYCNIRTDRLRGYLISCSSLLGVAMENPNPSLFDRAEACRKKGYQGIVSVLKEDNLKQELSIPHRTSIQDELSKSGQYLLHIQATLCNVVRTVVEGKAIVTPILGTLRMADEDTHVFLVELLTDMMKGASQPGRSNLKCFIWHLIQMLPSDSAFPQIVVKSDLAAYFNEAEVAEMAVEDIDSDHLYLQDLGMDVATAPTSYPSTRESSYNVSDVEGQLLAVYEPSVIRDLLTDLYENRGLHPSQIIALNERWEVPKEIRPGIEYLPDAEFKQAFVFILVAKARHCMELRIFERARQLLMEADAVVADLSYVVSKHVRWQILLADLMQYSVSQTVSETSSKQELVKKTKTCLTAIRLGQEILPNSEVLEQCTAFLLNIGDSEYLSNLENTANGFIEISRLLACTYKELSQNRNSKKAAKELWEALLKIYQTNQQTKRSASGRESATMYRDAQQGLLPRDAFVSYVQKIKEQTILSLLISAFAKFFSVLKHEVTCDITTEYASFWSFPVSGSNQMNTNAVEDALRTLMTHALRVNPHQPSWLRTQADIYLAEENYHAAMKFYLEAGVVATEFFSLPVERNIYDDKVYQKMIKCCSQLQCHTQVAVLCQCLEETDYTTAFKALQERNVYDAMDAYYCCIWDITILEYLVHLHSKKGEMDKRQCALRALGQMDLNSNNPEEIRRRAIHVRKTKFLRALAKQYVG